MEHSVSTAAPLSKKESAEMRRMDRLALGGRATRAQLLRGMRLHRQHDAAYRAAHGAQR